MQKLEKYLGSDYTYTPYIPEIAVMLKNPLQTLIICNLLNKLPAHNEEAKVKTKYGKDYHISFCQNKIFEKELGVPKTTFIENINKLSDYVSYDGNRVNNNSGYYTTYYLLNLDAIKNLFNEGKKLLGKKTVVKSESKFAYKKPLQSGNNKPLTNIDKDLKRINELQNNLNNNEIGKYEFNRSFQPLKKKLEDNKVKIIYNKNLKIWQKI